MATVARLIAANASGFDFPERMPADSLLLPCEGAIAIIDDN